VSTIDKSFNHRNLLRDVGDGTWFDVWRKQSQCSAITVKLFRPFLRKSLERLTAGLSSADGFIVNVRNIADMFDLDACDFEGATEHVL
jgi:hypothetical protein